MTDKRLESDTAFDEALAAANAAEFKKYGGNPPMAAREELDETAAEIAKMKAKSMKQVI